MRGFHNSSFDPQTLVVLQTAFDEAWLTDARDGRLKRKVRQAFGLYGGKPLTTTELVKQCYWSVNFQGEEIKSWHRTNVARVADLLAIRIGRAASQGRPILWSPRPELMQDRRWVGHKHGQSSRRTE